VDPPHLAPAPAGPGIGRGRREIALSSSRGAYEYGTSREMPGIVLESLPEG
jgi:hypothetical protein